MSTTTSPPKAPRFSLHRPWTDSLALIAAAAFIVLVVAGIFPRLPW
jgi:hypothetical protein